MKFSQEEQEKMMEEFQKEADFSETMTCDMICTLPINFMAKPNQPNENKGDVIDAREHC